MMLTCAEVDGLRASGVRIKEPKPAPRRDYAGYLQWAVLRVTKPSGERAAAERLERLEVYPYWPFFNRRICLRGGLRRSVMVPVFPGLLFIPTEMLDFANRDEVFDFCNVAFLKLAGRPMMLPKADVELIRRIQGKLSMPESSVDAKGNEIKVGQRVRFIDPQKVRMFGDGTVFEVAHDRRIGVEISGLFGGPQKYYDESAEIEVI